jgi:hypothetical protein
VVAATPQKGLERVGGRWVRHGARGANAYPTPRTVRK